MDFAAKKQWHQTHIDPKYSEADLALLKAKMQNQRALRRVALGNHEKVLWHLINNELATPEEILENRKVYAEPVEAKGEAESKPDQEKKPEQSLTQKAIAELVETKKKVVKVFNQPSKKFINQKNKNTQK